MNFSGSIPIGNAPTLTTLPWNSTPFGVVDSPLRDVSTSRQTTKGLGRSCGDGSNLQDSGTAAQEMASVIIGMEPDQIAM